MSETTNNITTTQTTRELAPGLLRNTIDERIVRIRPMSTPIDQISRCAGARGAKSMVVEYYSVDTKATSAKVSTPVGVSVVADSKAPPPPSPLPNPPRYPPSAPHRNPAGGGAYRQTPDIV